MSGIFATRLARRRVVTYAVLLVASLLLVAISSNPLVRDLQRGMAFALRPLQSAVDGVARDVRSVGFAISDIDRLRQENEQLRSDNERLELENRQATEVQRENEQLTALLQLRSGFEFRTLAAAVIGRDTSEVLRVMVIDRGTDDGLAVGQVVVAAGGALAGRITEVGPNFARVVLITDSTSTVIGQLLGSAATGKVIGELGGALLMRDVDSTATVSLGEEVFTAGIELAGGIRSPYPKGLLIGQVVDIARDPNEVVQTLYLQPASNLDRLEYVLVILDYEGGLPTPGESAAPCQPTASGTLPDSDQPCPTTVPAP
jgi:rod shape-determining protein MreC